MPDLEKAIRILEGSYKNFVLRHNGELVTVNELLALLKAQEPRLITEADFENADEYNYIPAWCEERIGGAGYWEMITPGALEEEDFRYWTIRPTLKQMEATSWE